ncbi:MAG: indolepyruvate ferredoxin oxidoreductase subunit beta [Dehalococcoidales bacterium]|nr:indolepyruvate ferredoxin oxidoreductase subunit beta [Dehalococcoidales bacterium]
MAKEFNVLITGVGGQGAILMSELLGEAAVKDDFNVRGSEALGMAVRGGSVVSTIRIGSEIYGPLIPMGKCHLLIGIEPAEALRNISYLSPSSLIILNLRGIVPFTVSQGKSNYPTQDEILEKLNRASRQVIRLDAACLAEEAGNPITANMVMLGAAFGGGQMPVKLETIKAVIQSHFPAKLAPVNIKAFDLGYQACQQAVKN